MPTPIEICLSSLLPTVSFLPPELISLCTSLLAQSRTKASSLKAEEEIARTYACCHIACQRLGHRLALEIGKPAPPVRPQVYERLKEYLNAVLKTTTGPRTPEAKKTVDKSNVGRPARTTTATPTKDKPAAAKTTPTSLKRRAPELELEPESGPEAANIPDHVKPLIRVVCNSSQEPRAIPHVFAGLSSILHHLSTLPSAAKRRKTSHDKAPTHIADSQIPNLIIALFVVVYNRFYDEEKVVDAPIEEAAIKALREEGGVVGRVGGEQRRSEEIHWFKEAVWTSWKDMEWIDNIPTPEDGLLPLSEEAAELVRGADDGEIDDDDVLRTPKRAVKTPLRRREKHAQRDDDELGAAGLLPGLGTMFQPAVNWLSEERCEHFEKWRKEVLREGRVAS